MSGKVSDLPIRNKRAAFTQKKLDRLNFRSGNGGRVLRNPPGVTRCWSRAWSHDSLSHGIDNMADRVRWQTRDGVDIRCSAVNVRPSCCDSARDLRWFQCYHLVSM